ncbi:MAG: response regulator [Lachnospiraceae bacterium]|nr:response regulator [Lachnospiraceae bacterium]
MNDEFAKNEEFKMNDELVISDEFAMIEESEEDEESDKSEESEKTEESDKAEDSDKSEESDKAEDSDKSEESEKTEESERKEEFTEIYVQHKKRIVAVDDSNVVLKTLKNVLDSEGYEFHPFSTGTRALEYLEHREKIPDLIILDIEMPIMNGYDVLARIKKIPHLRHVPVIFLTSNNQKKQVVKAVTDGVRDYVVKPIDREVLLKKLYLLLGN